MLKTNLDIINRYADVYVDRPSAKNRERLIDMIMAAVMLPDILTFYALHPQYGSIKKATDVTGVRAQFRTAIEKDINVIGLLIADLETGRIRIQE